jgi:hypothetical protein
MLADEAVAGRRGAPRYPIEVDRPDMAVSLG